jgi:pimeloyl-ACP methyl ester carboxylesterase
MNIDINGIDLHYEDVGTGRTILFLHGNSQDISMFSDAVEYFMDDCRCITVDSRGHGSSGRGKEQLTIPLLADDIVKFIEAMDLNDLILIGFSDGGNIALEVASVSERIKDMVIVGANLHPKGLTTSTRLLVGLVRAICLPFSFIPSLGCIRRRYRLISHQPPITDEKLSGITARTLVIAGTKDMVRTSHTEEICRKIPSASLRLFEGRGHFLFDTDTDELLKAIREFMSESQR